MTIARAYIAAGRPAKKGVKPLGSYGGWCGMVRDPLIWLGKDDPVQSMEAARQADPVRNALHTLIDVWRDTLQLNVGYAASDLIRIADTQESWDAMSNIATWEYPELRELLVRQGGTPRGFIESRKIGNWIMSVRGQVHDGYRIELMQKSEGHGNRFALVRVADASGG
jgi:putative DNA primase/helicase